LKIKSILLSQPEPTDLAKSPYTELEEKLGVTFDYRKFIKVEPLSSREFRKSKIHIEDFTAVIFTSRKAVDHFFEMAEKLRINISEAMKYFCISDSTAFYLQKYVQYRKRKIFYGKRTFDDLMDIIIKHKEENYLLPCSDNHKKSIPQKFKKNKISFMEAVMYRTVPCELNDLDIYSFDLIVFFSPNGVDSLYHNYPNFKQGDIKIAAFGKTTLTAVKKAGLKVEIEAPTAKAPSMSMAIDQYITELEKEKRRKK